MWHLVTLGKSVGLFETQSSNPLNGYMNSLLSWFSSPISRLSDKVLDDVVYLEVGLGRHKWGSRKSETGNRDKSVSCTSVMGCSSGQGGPNLVGGALRNPIEYASTVSRGELEAGSVAPLHSFPIGRRLSLGLTSQFCRQANPTRCWRNPQAEEQ